MKVGEMIVALGELKAALAQLHPDAETTAHPSLICVHEQNGYVSSFMIYDAPDGVAIITTRARKVSVEDPLPEQRKWMAENALRPPDPAGE